MTVIAYRDGALASDSLCTCADVRASSTVKIARCPDGSLCGASGYSGDAAAFIRWCVAGRPEDAKPKLTSLCALVISPSGEILMFEESLNWAVLDAPYYATGSGHALAIGAMAHGASAVEAVAIAIKHHTGCGGAIRVLRLDGSECNG
jgi:20S proteasome alpha/beta subunit